MEGKIYQSHRRHAITSLQSHSNQCLSRIFIPMSFSDNFKTIHTLLKSNQ